MKLVETGSFPIADIEIGDRLRNIDEEWAQGIAASVQETELQNPVQLLRTSGSSYLPDGVHLVAGAHRIRAFQLLGRADVPAKLHEPETDRPDLELRLGEIDENLNRRDLSALDRAVAIAERRRVLDELHGETRGRKQKTDNLSLFSVNDAVASKMGLHKRAVERSLRLARKLSPEAIKRLKDSRLADHQAELSAIVDACMLPVPLDPDKAAARQTEILDLMLCDPPKARTVKEAVSIIDKRPLAKTDNEKLYKTLTKAWLSAPKKVKSQFLEFLREQGAIGPSE